MILPMYADCGHDFAPIPDRPNDLPTKLWAAPQVGFELVYWSFIKPYS